jgi:hypothetical protein
MKSVRRTYDQKFKQMALKICLSGKSAKDVSGNLGMAPGF